MSHCYCKTYSNESLYALREKVLYEQWLIKNIYSVASDDIFPGYCSSITYYPDYLYPKVTHILKAKDLVIGDWRQSFLKVGAPLVFITTFKLIDMIVEWVLERNGINNCNNFESKKKAFTNSLILPEIFNVQNWLFERFKRLYCHLEPLRSTVLHNGHFKTEDGNISVSNSKKGRIGSEKNISDSDIRFLAFAIVIILHFIDNSWKADDYSINKLKYYLDNINSIHECEKLHVKYPIMISVLVYVNNYFDLNVDMCNLIGYVKSMYKNKEVYIDMRVNMVNSKEATEGYFLPWNTIKDLETVSMNTVNLCG